LFFAFAWLRQARLTRHIFRPLFSQTRRRDAAMMPFSPPTDTTPATM